MKDWDIIMKSHGELLAELLNIPAEVFTERTLREINGSEDVARHLMPKLKGENQEHFMLLALNIHHRLIGTSVVSVANLSGAVVHPREVFRDAMGYSASAIHAKMWRR